MLRCTLLPAALFSILVGVAGCAPQGEEIAGDWVYKIETGQALAGYAVVDTCLMVEDGEELIQLEQRYHYEARLMGTDLDTETHLTFLLEPAGKRLRRHSGESSSGSQTTRWSVELIGGQAHLFSSRARGEKILEMPPDAIVENTVFFDHLVSDFSGTGLREKLYQVLDFDDFEIRDVRYEAIAEETIELAGKSYTTIVVGRSVEATGAQSRMWIDSATGMLLKLTQPTGDVVSLADGSVIAGLGRVDLDPFIFQKTDVAIADVTGITYMKVRARLHPIGLQPTPETLNVPGQKFAGTVEDNLIEGVFEIEHPRYGGTGAPVFPPTKPSPDLLEYLVADDLYQADDEILAAQAREITGGAGDAWTAATRLAEWVSEEIAYALPGGTARQTYDRRAGECGAHSILLATFCRLVGIPARVVWGCMYTPNQGGSFGQHGWTEVHMGAAGWIPLDATMGETDFVDSGHIRVGRLGSLACRLNALEFQVLDYRLGRGHPESGTAARERFAPFLGRYRQAQSSSDYEVKILDGTLAVVSPDQTMLALDEPDEEGRWRCKAAKQVYVKFDRGGSEGTGDVKALTLYERYSLPRRASPEAPSADVPREFAPYLGRYHMAALAADFQVVWKRAGLALLHPRRNRVLRLAPCEKDGVWMTENGAYTVSFPTDENREVTSMTLETANRCVKR